MSIVAALRLKDMDVNHKLVEDIYDLGKVGVAYDLLAPIPIVYKWTNYHGNVYIYII